MKEQTLINHNVIFIHIPKTAGTTLSNIIERNYPANKRFSFGARAQKDIAHFKGLSHDQRTPIRLLNGHMAYGLHKYMVGPTTYITVLRDPIDRMVSFYYFVRNNPQHYLYDFVHSADLGLRTFLERKITIMFDNFQTRLISGVWEQYPVGECPPSILERAKTNLAEHFAVVGLTERFDETLLILRKTFGWHNIHYTRQQVTANRPSATSLDQDTLAALREANYMDIAIYHYAQELFDSQIRQQGSSFPHQVKAFQVINQPVGFFYQLCAFSIRGYLRRKVADIRS